MLADVEASELVFHGHSKNKKAFFNKDKSLIGTPDYVFRNQGGQKFIVEEKFSFQRENTRALSSPYENHLAQIACYMTLLEGLEAEYGYMLYWSYSISDYKGLYISSAQSFKVLATDDLSSVASRLLEDVVAFNQSGVSSFDKKKLNAWKCVNCVTTQICKHKTGVARRVTLPYESGAMDIDI